MGLQQHMILDEMKGHMKLEDEISCSKFAFHTICRLIDAFQGSNIDLVLLWKWLKEASRKVVAGLDGLIKLAICILSMIANLASCEWAFSSFGHTHTK